MLTIIPCSEFNDKRKIRTKFKIEIEICKLLNYVPIYLNTFEEYKYFLYLGNHI